MKQKRPTTKVPSSGPKSSAGNAKAGMTSKPGTSVKKPRPGY